MTEELKKDVETLSIILKDLPDEQKIEKVFLLGITAVLLCLSIVYLLVFYSQKMNIKIKA